MGRGLSELQKTILQMAYKNHVAERRLVPRWGLEISVVGISDLLGSYYTAHNIPYMCYSTRRPNHYQYKSFFDTREAANEHAEWLKENNFDFRHTWETTRDLYSTRNLRGDHERNYEGADLYSYEVLADFFRFSDAPRIQCNGEPCRLRRPGGERSAGDQHFDVARIGKARHNAAQAAVSRAFKRLADRGLLFHGYAGVHLTKSGFIEADKLANG